MSRAFDGVNQYVEIDRAVVLAPPFTVTTHFITDDLTISNGLFFIGDKDSAVEYYALLGAGTIGGDPIRALRRTAAATDWADTTTGFSANTHHHAAMVCPDNNNIAVFLDGGSKGTQVGVRAATGWDRTSIGRLGDSTPAAYVSGRQTEVAVWGVALSDRQIRMIALGYPPWLMRPEDLLGLWYPVGVRSDRDFSRHGFDMMHANSPTWGPDRQRLVSKREMSVDVPQTVGRRLTHHGSYPGSVVPLPYARVGGTTYFSTPSGVWSGVGTLTKETQKPVAGVWSGAGTIIKETMKNVAGAWSGGGTLVGRAGKVLSGAWSGAGALVKETLKVLAGVWSGGGFLGKGVGEDTAGVIGFGGTLSAVFFPAGTDGSFAAFQTAGAFGLTFGVRPMGLTTAMPRRMGLTQVRR